MMKKLKIRQGYVRTDGAYYCLSDLYKISGRMKHKLDPWDWAKECGQTRDISRRGFIFRSQWARLSTVFQYADYLSVWLQAEIREELNLPRPFMSHAEKTASDVNKSMARSIEQMARSSITHHRSGRSSITHHRSDPVMAYSAITDDWQSSSWSGDCSDSGNSGGGGCD